MSREERTGQPFNSNLGWQDNTERPIRSRQPHGGGQHPIDFAAEQGLVHGGRVTPNLEVLRRQDRIQANTVNKYNERSEDSERLNTILATIQDLRGNIVDKESEIEKNMTKYA